MGLHKFLSILFLLFTAGILQAQDIIPTKGKEFWFGFLQNFNSSPDLNEALNVFIASDQDTEGIIEIPGQGFSQTFTVQANVITTINIPQAMGEHISNEVIDSKGIHILSEDTIAVFAINFVDYTADGSKILPVQSLGNDYRIVSYQGLGEWGSEFLIVATEDDTEIEIIPTAPTLSGNPANVPFIIQLDEGESYQVKTNGTFDFTGTTIKGTAASGDCRPFAVFSGTACVNIPVGCGACDHIFDQNFPANTWGTTYYTVPFNGTTGYTYRILAHEDNTEIYINGALTDNLNSGEFIEFNNVSQALCITGSNPINVTQYLQGFDCSGAGDPAMLILNDETQKIDYITFSTVDSDIITQHSLNIVINTSQVGSALLNGAIIDPNEFNVYPDCPTHSYAQITIPEGIYTLEAPEGFSAYVYGVGDAESYAYSVGSFSSDPVIIENVTCSSDTITITAGINMQNVYWYAQSNPDVIIENGSQLTLIPPIITDIYVAVGNEFQSGCTQEELFSVEVPDPPTLIISPDVEICKYQDVQLNVEVIPNSTNYTYTWTPSTGLNNPNIANPIATPLETTTYDVLVSTLSGCGSNIASVTIAVTEGNITNFDASASENILCEGESTQLFADIQELLFEDDFDPINNSNWAGISNGSVDPGCGSETGNALWFNGTGERSVTTIPLDVSMGGTINFSLKIGAGAFPCDNADFGENVVLEYSTGGGWNIIQTFIESQYPNFTGIEVPIPDAALSGNTSFRWRQIANSGDGQDNWALDNIFIGSGNLTGLTYLWSPDYNLTSTTIANPIADPLVNTTYFISMTDNNTGCSYLDSVFIQVDEVFALDFPDDTVICSASPIQLYATPDVPGNYEWQWTGGGLNNPFIEDPLASPTQTTTYSVVVSSEGNCSATDEMTITVNQLIDLNITASDDVVCAGESIALNAEIEGSSNEITYSWSPPEGLDNPNIANPIATIEGEVTYTLTITDVESGCQIQQDIDLEALEDFTIHAGEDQVLCTVEGFILNATTNSTSPLTWEWTNPQFLNNGNIPNPTLVVNESVILEVTATNAAGCSKTDEIALTLVHEAVDLGDFISKCEGETEVLSTGLDNSITHLWNTNQTTPTIEVTQSGIYSVFIEFPGGCEYSDEVEVFFAEVPVIELGNPPQVCEGEVITLDAGNPGSSFQWNTGQQTQTISVNQSGFYSVLVENEFGCTTGDNINLTFYPVPEINLPVESTICSNDSITFDAGNAGANYLWSNGVHTQTMTTNIQETYFLVVVNEFGCTGTGQTVLNVEQQPVFDLGDDRGFCMGEKEKLTTGFPEDGPLQTIWNTGNTINTIEVSSTGLYAATVFTDVCSFTDRVTIYFDAPANNPFPEEINFCFDDCPEGHTLFAGNHGYSYLWDQDSTTQTIVAPLPGAYSVAITSPHGCERQFTATVADHCPGKVFVPNSFTPNGDGLNDLFRVVAGDDIENFTLVIWNRWGEEVWSTNDPKQSWNGNGGTSRGYLSESEIFNYSLKYKRFGGCLGDIPVLEEINGHITLIR